MIQHEGIGMTSRRTRSRLIERLRSQGITSEAVLEAIWETPRHIFVDEALASRAYEDTALPIGFSQTISAPVTVARMTEALLQGGPLSKVLEIGTGSGYQAAILARLIPEVYTVERIQALQRKAQQRFYNLRLRNIRLKHSDGKQGWPEYAPYDGIIATAAPAVVPEALLEQLTLGGRLIIPVGSGVQQELRRIVRTETGYRDERLHEATFVPMLTGNK